MNDVNTKIRTKDFPIKQTRQLGSYKRVLTSNYKKIKTR